MLFKRVTSPFSVASIKSRTWCLHSGTGGVAADDAGGGLM